MNALAEMDEEAVEPADPERTMWEEYRTSPTPARREEIFSFYLPFARQLAARHARRSGGDLEIDDLRQLACAGLLEAIDRFDPGVGAPFRAFASRRIAGNISDGAGKSSERREQFAFKRRFRSERLRSLAPDEVDKLSTADALDALAELAVSLALGFMIEQAEPEVAVQAPRPQASAYQSLAWKETVQKLGAAIASLPPRESVIVRHHYLNGLTFDQIGDLLGLTKGRISQLHKGAMALLRGQLTRQGHRLE